MYYAAIDERSACIPTVGLRENASGDGVVSQCFIVQRIPGFQSIVGKSGEVLRGWARSGAPTLLVAGTFTPQRWRWESGVDLASI